MNREEAEAHWKYTEAIILKMLEVVHEAYVLGMIHGAKHEEETTND